MRGVAQTVMSGKEDERGRNEAPAGKSARERAGAPGFPIVGIGASAGGLKAAEAFLRNAPAAAGMAYVLVFHLDPHRESEAADLLQSHTKMPVAQLARRTPLEPDHVYVIPPNHGLVLAAGALELTELVHADGRPTVIDRFFRSLAAEAGERAIGVVLSGTGTEGSQGLKTIKEAAGLTVAQDEADAEYGGMPRSANATGMVDFVLAAAEMPAKLLEVRGSPIEFALPGGEEEAHASDARLLQKIFVQLRRRADHDFSHYKRATVLRRIARRMQVHQMPGLAAYLEVLREDPAETEALFRELLISVTNFFRDPEAMDVLAREVIPELCEKLRGGTLRVWVPGCATGEEAYSLAMLLSEACEGLASPPRVQIFATDVDERALATARRGLYPDAIAGDVSDARLARFFERAGSEFAVKASLRETILFTRHDLLRDPPFSRLDLVSCRNLLIYLKSDIQAKVFGLFHFALNHEGCLFLGGSESLGGSGKLFAELDRKAKIFRRRHVPGAELRLPPLAGVGNTGASRREPENGAKSFEGLAEEALLARYAPPCVIVDENYDAVWISPGCGKFLAPGTGAGNYNVIEMAREGLRLELRTALYRAFHAGKATHAKRLRVQTDGVGEPIALTVEPLAGGEGHLLVVFEELETDAAAPEAARSDDDGVIAQLEAELGDTRESLQTSVEELETSNEELRASNEELLSMNEELQSTTEELETGKEELQSTNEELLAVNQELREKSDALAGANADLANLIASTGIATLFLDGNLRVRRYTPPATELFNLIPGDVGRPFAHLTHKLEAESLADDAARVLRDLALVEKEIGDGSGHFYQVRLQPYRDVGERIAGVVLTCVDVSERVRWQRWREEETRLLELVASVGTLDDALRALCESLAGLLGGGWAAVILADEERTGIARAVSARLPAAFTEALAGAPIGEGRAGAAAAAIREDRPVSCPDIGGGTYGAKTWRELCTAHGVRACHATPVRDRAGVARGALLLCFDQVHELDRWERRLGGLGAHVASFAVQRERADRALHDSEKRFRVLVDNISEMVYRASPEWKVMNVLEGGAFLADTSAPDESWMEDYIPRADHERVRAAIDKAIGNAEVFELEHRVIRDDGAIGWVASHAAPIFDEAGSITEWFGSAVDITGRKRSEQHRKLLLNELNHRVRNTLATVQSIAMQTLGGSPANAELVWRFESRLMALANTHKLLTRRHWRAVALHELLGQELEPFVSGERARAAIRGADVDLRSNAGLALGMAFHELATNAVKYGALSQAGGRIEIATERLGGAEPWLRLVWTETGGPEVEKPEHRGFGTRLVGRGLACELAGKVEMDYRREGLVCTIEFPLAENSGGG